MKKKLICFLVFILFTLTIYVPSSAKSVEAEDIEIDVPDNFTIINKENAADNKEYLETIKFSEKSFKDYLSNKSVILYSTDKQGTEITVTKKIGDFSKEVNDLYFLQTDDIEKVFNKYFEKTPYYIADCGANRFLVFEYSSNDKGGEFSGVQFITVKNGCMYYINYTVPDGNSINQGVQQSLIASFKYNGDSALNDVKPDTVVTIIILALAIIVFIGVAAYIIYTFVIDIKSRKDQSDVAPYVKIKRRKF